MFGVLAALPKPSKPPFKETFPELDIVNLLELASKSAIKNSPALLLPNSYFFPLVAPV